MKKFGFVFELFLVLVLVFLVFYAADLYIDRERCKAVGAESGMVSRLDAGGGCVLEMSPGQWVPVTLESR